MRFLVAFIFSILHLAVFSQEMYFENISNTMKLPSQECYHILQDTKGYIWFATEQGLCRYDGEGLSVYNEKNGLPEKAVYALEMDESGKIWIITSTNRILYIDNEKLQEASFSNAFRQISKGRIVTSLVFVNAEEMYLDTYVRGTFLINKKTGACTEIKHTQHYYDYDVNLINNKLIAFNGRANEDVRPKPPISEKLNYFISGKLKQVVVVPQIKLPVRSTFLLTCSMADKKYVAFGQNLIVLNPDGTHETHRLPGVVLSMYADEDGGLWIGTLLKGVFYYNSADLQSKPINSLNNYSVSGIIKDAEGNIWCTTLEKGLFFCRNEKVWSYSIPNMQQNPQVLTYLNGNLFVTWQKKIYVLNDSVLKEVSFDVTSPDYITDISFFNHKYYISSHGFLVLTDENFTRIHPVRKQNWPYNCAAKQLKSANGKLYTLGSSLIGEIKGLVCNYRKSVPAMPLGTCFEPLDNDCFLVGTRDGLWKVTWMGDRSSIIRIPGITQPVSDILKDKKGRIFIATKGEGLFLYKDEKLLAVNRWFAIPARIIFEIVQDVNENYWISSNEGLYCCTMQGSRVSTRVYTQSDGLPADEVRELAATPDRIFFSSVFGISSLPLDSEEKRGNPRIYLSNLQINNKHINTGHLPHQLKYSQNTFRFHFDILSFKDFSPHIAYQLKGRDKVFSHSNSTELVLENLSPGKYKLIVYGENSKGIRSTQPFVYTFYISKPFWQTWWFIALELVTMVLIFIFVLRVLIRRAQKKSEEKNRINALLAESQLTALQAQMNPHFVFNAINSIQNYILKNQKEEAYNYLAKFSHLIRMILYNSQKKIVILAKELEILSLYVELEQMRCKQSFDFEVDLNETIDENEVLLPPTLIQPLLENAIWHGLIPLKNRRGKLRLLFAIENNLLKVVIEDNGIGRNQSKREKPGIDHHSMALNLVNDRIQMTGQLYDAMEDASIQIVDLYDETNNPQGTRVEIYLPLL